jgi:hypothetical protein
MVLVIRGYAGNLISHEDTTWYTIATTTSSLDLRMSSPTLTGVLALVLVETMVVDF